MKIIKVLIAIIFLVSVSILIKKSLDKKNGIKKDAPAEKMESGSYWTCPMHPQIHSEHPGECPICHMKLVKVETQPQQESRQQTGDERAVVQASPNQLNAIGVQITTVEKMTLVAKIPVSGRIVSQSSVAFQAYERDVRYLREGLKFKGFGSIYPEDEIRGTITSVDTIVDPASRTVRVLGQIQESARGLIPESSFRGEVEIRLIDRIAIPESSVLHTGQGDLVYVAENNSLAAKKISLGLKTNSFYEVLSGLNVGDTISSGPNFLIDSEAKIRGAND